MTSSYKEISAAGVVGTLIGALLIAAALYDPFDPNFCVEGCGRRLLGWILWGASTLFGYWGARSLLLVVGGVLVIKSWRMKIPLTRKKNAGFR